MRNLFLWFVVGPFTVVLGLVFALAFGLLGGAIVGACILLWPFAKIYDALNAGITRAMRNWQAKK